MSWRLIFSGFQSLGWTIYAIVGVLLAIGLTHWLMRQERRLVSRRVGFFLVSLRILVLLTLLLTLLKPVLTKQFNVIQQGRVIVAIDGSLSMETQDRHALMSEKLRWAQAIGMLGTTETSSLIDQWVADSEAGRTPNWLGSNVSKNNPVERSKADARRQQVNESLQELAEMPRLEFVRRLLQSQPAMLLDQLNNILTVDVRMFASQQQTATAESLASDLNASRKSLETGHTDVLQMLQSVVSQEGSGPVRAIVLISDGRQTLPGDVAATGERLSSLGVPVYSVPIGSRLPPRDLSVAAVDAPDAVFLNDKAQVRALLVTSGFEGEPLQIRLERDGVVVEQQSVTPVSDTTNVTFSLSSDHAGRFEYKLVTDVRPGELRVDNNAREIAVTVVDNKARVMVVEGDARWEFRYFKNLLDRDKQVEPRTVLLHQPFLDLLDQPPIQNKMPERDAFREQLAQTDLLVVGDIRPDDVDNGVWDLIEYAVARDGLTLIVVPGRKYMPHESASPILSSLLPVRDYRQRLAEQFQASSPDAEQTVFRLLPTAEAQSLPMFQLSPSTDQRNSSLSELPGHPWAYTGVPKSGASVWANVAVSGTAMESEPAIVHHDYGFGQVVWMGIDSTWRWRRRAGDEWHYKFWGQLIRWASRNKTAAGNSDVRMSLSDFSVSESESSEVVVRWNPKLLQQLNGATVEVVATPINRSPNSDFSKGNSGPDQKGDNSLGGASISERSDNEESDDGSVVVRLQTAPDSAERFTGRLPQLAAGSWQIELRLTGGSLLLKEPVKTELFVKHQVSAELVNVSCDRDLLRQLSQLSGGELVEPYNAQRLVTLIRPKDQPDQKSLERTLWDHWMVVVIFFTLLMTEWVVRKLNGLP